MTTRATRFISDPPETPFAPTWDFTLARMQTDIDVKSLAEVILSKEKEIIDTYPGDMTFMPLDKEGINTVAEESVTARFKYFNVLKWDHPECKKLHQSIKKLHEQYFTGLIPDVPIPRMKVRCWCNVMRKNEQIGKHNHSIHSLTYLSGNLCVSAIDTTTNYIPPYLEWGDEVVFENVPGEITIFPQWMIHYTSKHLHDEPRISVAFDLVPFDLDPDDNDNLIEL